MCAHLWLKTGDQKEPIPGFRPLFPPKSAFLLGNHQFCPPASACFWILCEPKSKNSEPKSKFGSLKIKKGEPKRKKSSYKSENSEPKMKFGSLKFFFGSYKIGKGEPKSQNGSPENGSGSIKIWGDTRKMAGNAGFRRSLAGCGAKIQIGYGLSHSADGTCIKWPGIEANGAGDECTFFQMNLPMV
jgi:hypothetical protein